jgi:hypothetical protein
MAVTHTYEPLPVSYEVATIVARCSCGWQAAAPAAYPEAAKELWQYHEHRVDPAKAAARRRLREAAK